MSSPNQTRPAPETERARLPEYTEILSFLAKHPPQRASERDLHASLLQLIATSMRDAEITRRR